MTQGEFFSLETDKSGAQWAEMWKLQQGKNRHSRQESLALPLIHSPLPGVLCSQITGADNSSGSPLQALGADQTEGIQGTARLAEAKGYMKAREPGQCCNCRASQQKETQQEELGRLQKEVDHKASPNRQVGTQWWRGNQEMKSRDLPWIIPLSPNFFSCSIT